eukprot:1394308-Pleurochrysis_carterae.AAC.4
MGNGRECARSAAAEQWRLRSVSTRQEAVLLGSAAFTTISCVTTEGKYRISEGQKRKGMEMGEGSGGLLRRTAGCISAAQIVSADERLLSVIADTHAPSLGELLRFRTSNGSRPRASSPGGAGTQQKRSRPTIGASSHDESSKSERCDEPKRGRSVCEPSSTQTAGEGRARRRRARVLDSAESLDGSADAP